MCSCGVVAGGRSNAATGEYVTVNAMFRFRAVVIVPTMVVMPYYGRVTAIGGGESNSATAMYGLQ